MLQKLLIILIFFSYSILNAQSSYESGYIVNNNGNKISCFIKNEDWVNSPKKISYKTSLDSNDVISAEINDINGFGIGENIVFKKFTVDFDTSSSKTSDMSMIMEPVFQKETILLRQLVEGNANLYYYDGGSIVRFFYSINNEDESKLKPLVYKKYKLSNGDIAINASFRSELYYELQCKDLSVEDSKKLDYEKNDLIGFFNSYNLCTGSNSKIYRKASKKPQFNYKVKAGITSFKAKFLNEEDNLFTDLISVDLNNSTNIRFGVEVEYILPFNNNKWSLFAEPSYQSYEGTGTDSRTDPRGEVNVTNASLTYSYIDLPIGLRHYLFLNDTSRIFMNIAWVSVFDIDSDVEYYNNTLDLPIEVKSGGNLLLGIGFDYNNKFSLEARYSTERNVTNSVRTVSKYSGASLILGYTIF